MAASRLVIYATIIIGLQSQLNTTAFNFNIGDNCFVTIDCATSYLEEHYIQKRGLNAFVDILNREGNLAKDHICQCKFGYVPLQCPGKVFIFFKTITKWCDMYDKKKITNSNRLPLSGLQQMRNKKYSSFKRPVHRFSPPRAKSRNFDFKEKMHNPFFSAMNTRTENIFDRHPNSVSDKFRFSRPRIPRNRITQMHMKPMRYGMHHRLSQYRMKRSISNELPIGHISLNPKQQTNNKETYKRSRDTNKLWFEPITSFSKLVKAASYLLHIPNPMVEFHLFEKSTIDESILNKMNIKETTFYFISLESPKTVLSTKLWGEIIFKDIENATSFATIGFELQKVANHAFLLKYNIKTNSLNNHNLDFNILFPTLKKKEVNNKTMMADEFLVLFGHKFKSSFIEELFSNTLVNEKNIAKESLYFKQLNKNGTYLKLGKESKVELFTHYTFALKSTDINDLVHSMKNSEKRRLCLYILGCPGNNNAISPQRSFNVKFSGTLLVKNVNSTRGSSKLDFTIHPLPSDKSRLTYSISSKYDENSDKIDLLKLFTDNDLFPKENDGNTNNKVIIDKPGIDVGKNLLDLLKFNYILEPRAIHRLNKRSILSSNQQQRMLTISIPSRTIMLIKTLNNALTSGSKIMDNDNASNSLAMYTLQLLKDLDEIIKAKSYTDQSLPKGNYLQDDVYRLRNRNNEDISSDEKINNWLNYQKDNFKSDLNSENFYTNNFANIINDRNVIKRSLLNKNNIVYEDLKNELPGLLNQVINENIEESDAKIRQQRKRHSNGPYYNFQDHLNWYESSPYNDNSQQNKYTDNQEIPPSYEKYLRGGFDFPLNDKNVQSHVSVFRGQPDLEMVGLNIDQIKNEDLEEKQNIQSNIPKLHHDDDDFSEEFKWNTGYNSKNVDHFRQPNHHSQNKVQDSVFDDIFYAMRYTPGPSNLDSEFDNDNSNTLPAHTSEEILESSDNSLRSETSSNQLNTVKNNSPSGLSSNTPQQSNTSGSHTIDSPKPFKFSNPASSFIFDNARLNLPKMSLESESTPSIQTKENIPIESAVDLPRLRTEKLNNQNSIPGLVPKLDLDFMDRINSGFNPVNLMETDNNLEYDLNVDSKYEPTKIPTSTQKLDELPAPQIKNWNWNSNIDILDDKSINENKLDTFNDLHSVNQEIADRNFDLESNVLAEKNKMLYSQSFDNVETEVQKSDQKTGNTDLSISKDFNKSDFKSKEVSLNTPNTKTSYDDILQIPSINTKSNPNKQNIIPEKSKTFKDIPQTSIFKKSEANTPIDNKPNNIHTSLNEDILQITTKNGPIKPVQIQIKKIKSTDTENSSVKNELQDLSAQEKSTTKIKIKSTTEITPTPQATVISYNATTCPIRKYYQLKSCHTIIESCDRMEVLITTKYIDTLYKNEGYNCTLTIKVVDPSSRAIGIKFTENTFMSDIEDCDSNYVQYRTSTTDISDRMCGSLSNKVIHPKPGVRDLTLRFSASSPDRRHPKHHLSMVVKEFNLRSKGKRQTITGPIFSQITMFTYELGTGNSLETDEAKTFATRFRSAHSPLVYVLVPLMVSVVVYGLLCRSRRSKQRTANN